MKETVRLQVNTYYKNNGLQDALLLGRRGIPIIFMSLLIKQVLLHIYPIL